MGKPISEQVVVITGASSGIGRETALQFARRGAMVVLTARNEEALRAVEEQISREGGRAVAIPADVSDWSQVQGVVQRTVEMFGRIDTWVNNAAVSVYGTFRQVPVEEFRRVLDVNLMGHVHGAKAALPHLARAGGTLIGVGAASSEYPMPLQSAYTSSAWALKGLYDTLRLEQEHEQSGVQVSLVMPSSVDTPFFEHAKSYLGVKPGPLPPVYEPATVAKTIIYAAQRPVRDVNVGPGALLSLAAEVWPRAADAYIKRVAFTEQLTYQPEPPEAPNNLWQPVPGTGAIGGGYRSVPVEPFSWLQTHPVARTALAGVAFSSIALPIAGLALAGLAIPAGLLIGRRRPLGIISRRGMGERQGGLLSGLTGLAISSSILNALLRPVVRRLTR
jgi:NAD(P)-dependent dehydrogenase (short-subunit alcohol dehydrogenase family)